jgi:HAD superfamily hydrolase (TIGR01549 family)
MSGVIPNPLGRGTDIRAVLFDLDGTLYRQRLIRALMALELLTLPLDGPLKAGRRLKALRAFRGAQETLRRGEVSHPPSDVRAAQCQTAADASGLPVAEVQELAEEWMNRRPLKYLQFCRATGLDALLDVIEGAGVKAGILSDYPADDKLHALGLAGRFAPVLCASDPAIGAFKPSPRGYLRACEIWGLAPEQVLYVGDRAEVDAAGAEAAGMPCAIVGRRPTRSHAGWATFESLEKLTRVLDHRP